MLFYVIPYTYLKSSEIQKDIAGSANHCDIWDSGDTSNTWVIIRRTLFQ